MRVPTCGATEAGEALRRIQSADFNSTVHTGSTQRVESLPRRRVPFVFLDEAAAAKPGAPGVQRTSPAFDPRASPFRASSPARATHLC